MNCFNGTTPHVLYMVTGNCAVEEVDLKTNTDQDAESCRQAVVDGGNGKIEVSAVDGAPPTFASVCFDGHGAVQFWRYGDQQLTQCELNYCSSCSWASADQNGNCPFGP